MPFTLFTVRLCIFDVMIGIAEGATLSDCRISIILIESESMVKSLHCLKGRPILWDHRPTRISLTSTSPPFVYLTPF